METPAPWTAGAGAMTSVVSGDDLRVGVSFDASPDRSVVLGLEDGNEDDGMGDGVRKFGANDGSTVESSITWDGTSGGCSIGPVLGLLRAGDPLIHRSGCTAFWLPQRASGNELDRNPNASSAP